MFYVEESFDGDWLDDLYREYKGFEEVCRMFVWFEEIFNFKLFLKVLKFNNIFFFLVYCRGYVYKKELGKWKKF